MTCIKGPCTNLKTKKLDLDRKVLVLTLKLKNFDLRDLWSPCTNLKTKKLDLDRKVLVLTLNSTVYK